MRMVDAPEPPLAALAFAGGLSLAAYHGGAYQAFTQQGLPLHRVAGSSAGAITAALIAGNAPERRVARLREFWGIVTDTAPWHPFAHAEGWLSAIMAHLAGDPWYFHPRLPNPIGFRSLYDLGPMRRRLAGMIDFGRLNDGGLQIFIATTDVRTGDPVIFQNGADRIELDHLLASCGFLPEFAPVTIDKRTLVDGGLSLNAPFDPILEQDGDALRLFVIDLYARDDELPTSLEAALERKNDLLFGNQTYLRLKDKLTIRRLRRELAGTVARDDLVYLLSYRADSSEPGPEKSFNFSRSALTRRWQAGFDDMTDALTTERSSTDEVRVVRRKQPSARALLG